MSLLVVFCVVHCLPPLFPALNHPQNLHWMKNLLPLICRHETGRVSLSSRESSRALCLQGHSGALQLPSAEALRWPGASGRAFGCMAPVWDPLLADSVSLLAPFRNPFQ